MFFVDVVSGMFTILVIILKIYTCCTIIDPFLLVVVGYVIIKGYYLELFADL